MRSNSRTHGRLGAFAILAGLLICAAAGLRVFGWRASARPATQPPPGVGRSH